MNKVTSIFLAGVGGQGIILAGRVISQAVASLGGEVKVSDIHGMAQRGGSVVTQLRFGPRVNAPVIIPGTADFLVAFEKLEARRWLHYLNKDGILIVNDQEIPPMPVLTGSAAYPSNLVTEMQAVVKDIRVIDAVGLARRAGNVKTANIVLVGVLARHLPVAREAWEKVIAASVPEKILAVNQKAFQLGWEDCR